MEKYEIVINGVKIELSRREIEDVRACFDKGHKDGTIGHELKAELIKAVYKSTEK